VARGMVQRMNHVLLVLFEQGGIGQRCIHFINLIWQRVLSLLAGDN
jgi:hypothetical protein